MLDIDIESYEVVSRLLKKLILFKIFLYYLIVKSYHKNIVQNCFVFIFILQYEINFIKELYYSK